MTRLRVTTCSLVWLALAETAGQAWAADAPWQPLACVPADLATEDLFEVVQPVDGFANAKPKWAVAVGGQHAQATVQHDPAEHHGGGGSLRVEYDFVEKKDYEYIQLNGQAEFAKPGLGFGFWLQHDGTPTVTVPAQMRARDFTAVPQFCRASRCQTSNEATSPDHTHLRSHAPLKHGAPRSVECHIPQRQPARSVLVLGVVGHAQERTLGEGVRHP